MKDSMILKFLYKTVPGRMLLMLLVQPKVSEIAGLILSSKVSKWLVPYYIRRHQIDMNNIEIPPGGFESFNDFFTRKHKTEHFASSPVKLICPCDGFLTVTEIRQDSVFFIKHTWYNLEELLMDRILAEKFEGGIALIFRLTPANYHRYCYAADGRILRSGKIKGKLHCVRPIALSSVPVFVQNSREYQVIETIRFGTMVQMEIGALLVGKIKNHKMHIEGREVKAGEEKGYFEFGGSTIILLLSKGAIGGSGRLYQEKHSEGEIRVCQGEELSKK